jgi:hypothetical protein
MKADANTAPDRRLRLRAPALHVDRKLVGWTAVFALFLMVTYTAYSWSLRSGIDSLREADITGQRAGQVERHLHTRPERRCAGGQQLEQAVQLCWR